MIRPGGSAFGEGPPRCGDKRGAICVLERSGGSELAASENLGAGCGNWKPKLRHAHAMGLKSMCKSKGDVEPKVGG